VNNNQIVLTNVTKVLKTHLKSGSVHQMINRPETSFIIFIRGKCDFIFSDTVISCDAEHGIFVPQGTSYTIKCHECSESILFSFIGGHESSPFSVKGFDKKTVVNLFEETEREFLKTDKSFNKIFSLYYQVFFELLDMKSGFDKGEEYVRLAENIIIKNLSDTSLSCNSVASEINVSEVYLRKLFSKYRGISPSKYILDLRMKKARAFLSEHYPVGETSEMVGYSDIYQFSRVYKKYYGYSPAKTVQKPL